MRRRRSILWAAAALAVVALLARWALRPRPIEVEAVRVDAGAVEDVVANSEGGTVLSRARARLGAERAGRVAVIPHREGARVRRGDVLLGLESATARTRLEAARREVDVLRAALEAATAREVQARRALDRIDALGQQDLVSAEIHDDARTSRDAAEAERRAAEARLAGAESAVRLAQDELAHHVVRAPFDGVLTRRFVEVGEPVTPGQGVLELIGLDRLYVSAPIDERDAGRISPGLPARVTLDAYPDVEWPAAVTRVAPMLETQREQNRTLEVELDLQPDPTRPAPRPGMTADVEIVLSRREGVLRVPSMALVEGRSAWVVVRGRVASREVEAGLRNWQWTEVRSGLTRGDLVITSLDRLGLAPGVAVKITGPAAGAAPDTGAAAMLP